MFRPFHAHVSCAALSTYRVAHAENGRPNRDDSDSPLRGLYNLTVEEETVIRGRLLGRGGDVREDVPGVREELVAKFTRAIYCRDSCRVVAWQRRQRT